MKALDTNLLVRFLVNDDVEQAEKVKTLFECAETDNGVFIISTAVVLELIWVLSAVYDCTRADILNAIEQLCMMPILRFEQSDLVHQLISLGRITTTDLPDILIGLSARTIGCETTLTFDRKAATSELFELA